MDECAFRIKRCLMSIYRRLFSVITPLPVPSHVENCVSWIADEIIHKLGSVIDSAKHRDDEPECSWPEARAGDWQFNLQHDKVLIDRGSVMNPRINPGACSFPHGSYEPET